MPLFIYQALSEKGKKTKGTIDADTMQEARLKLVRREIIALSIDLLSEKESSASLTVNETLSITRELTRLLQAGLPLFEALCALEEKYTGQKPHHFLLDCCEKIRMGHPFAFALAKHPKTFNLLYIAMVSNAEKTGTLSEALLELTELLTRQLQIRKQVLSALLYPALLSGFCLIVLSSLLFFVIPSLRELFDGRDLHLFTRIVFYASDFACRSKGILLSFMLTVILFTSLIFCLPRWKKRFYRRLLSLPLLKNFYARVALIRFCRAAGTLLDGGLPLIEAFAQARSVMGHSALEDIIGKSEEKISQGVSLSVAFSGHNLIPPLVPRMLGIAEKSGKLSFTMHQIAQIYEDELETTLSYFSSAAQPILLIVLGALVGFVLLSVLLPLTDVSSFIGSS
jgi:general secretion pathway protein F/type IV pilus assembly protein PilC